MERSWVDAIKRVLRETEAPLHYTEISEQVLSRGYYVTDGATPAATVNALITSSIKHDGERSPFIKVGRGNLLTAELIFISKPTQSTCHREDS